MTTLAEGSNVGALSTFMENREELRTRSQNLLSPEAKEKYDAASKVFEQGRGAAGIRQQNAVNYKSSLGDKQSDLWRTELQLQSQDAGDSSVQQFVKVKQYDFSRFMGADPRAAAGSAKLAANPFQIVTQAASGFGEMKQGVADLEMRLAERSGESGAGGVMNRNVELFNQLVEQQRDKSTGDKAPEVASEPRKKYTFQPPKIRGSRLISRTGNAPVEETEDLPRPSPEGARTPPADPAMNEQNELLRQQNRLVEEQLRVMKNTVAPPVADWKPNTTPAGPVNSAANDDRKRP